MVNTWEDRTLKKTKPQRVRHPIQKPAPPAGKILKRRSRVESEKEEPTFCKTARSQKAPPLPKTNPQGWATQKHLKALRMRHPPLHNAQGWGTRATNVCARTV